GSPANSSAPHPPTPPTRRPPGTPPSPPGPSGGSSPRWRTQAPGRHLVRRLGAAPLAGPGRGQGPRLSMLLESHDFPEAGRVHHAPHHLAAEAVPDRMTLQKRHREAPQPTQVVAQRALAGAAVVLAEGHIQHPVHRLDPPVTAHRLAEALAAEVSAENVIPRLV